VGPLPNSHSWLVNGVDGRNSAPVEVGRFSHHLQGFKHAVEGSGFQVSTIGILNFQGYHPIKTGQVFHPRKKKPKQPKTRGKFFFHGAIFLAFFAKKRTPSSGDEKPYPLSQGVQADQTLPIGRSSRESFKNGSS